MIQEQDPVDDFYQNYYQRVFVQGNSISNFAYKATHWLMERNLSTYHFPRVLEIGAGSGEHLSFVKHTFDEYIMVDKQSPNVIPQPLNASSSTSFIKSDILACAFEPKSFDRIIFTCVLHHLENPFLVLKLVDSWLKDDGLVTIFLPCDPGFSNRVVRQIFVSPKCNRLGFHDYELVNALEHHGHFWGIRRLILSVFEHCKISTRFYPLGIPVANLSLFTIITIKKTRYTK